MKKFFLLSIILFVVGMISQQLNAQTYVHVIEEANPNVDFIQQSVVEISTGEYIIAGTVTPGPVSGNSDILVLKVDDSANILWSRYVDYGNDEFVGSLIIDNAGHVVLTGYEGINGGVGPKDLIIVKLDSSGNLVSDMVIHDDELKYSLYGFDLKQTNSGDYIIAGVGTRSATATSSKYAFVLRIANNLTSVYWGYRYQSSGTTTRYDSFNHILKVQNHPFGEVYLLTGSGADPATDMQMVANDLISPAGNSLWGGAVGNRENDLYNNPTVMALYKEDANRFFVLYHGTENWPSLLLLDGNTGSGIGAGNFAKDVNVIVNGMVWRDNNQTEIAWSGYYIEDITSSPPGIIGMGRPMFVTLDITTPLPLYPWVLYKTPFNGIDFKNIPFDFIVKPINYSHPSFSYVVNQSYYKPKALIHSTSSPGYIFAEPYQDQTSDPFGMNLFKTDINGLLSSTCIVDMYDVGIDLDINLDEYSNFDRFAHDFTTIGPGANIFPASPSHFTTCGAPSPLPKPSMGTNETHDNTKILIYPNPATETVYVSGLSGIENVRINVYDVTGRKVIGKSTGNQNQISLSVSHLQNGIYFLQIATSGKILHQKKIIKE